MDPAIVVEEALPDGRRLVVYADGRELVVGRAGPRPHPVPGWAWLGQRLRPFVSTAAEQRAEALLVSLLDAGQRRDYRATGGFWVPTPFGPVRLGTLYSLVHHPTGRPTIEQVLCVVPRGHTDLPRADIWTNVLLTLAVEPEEFFRVAVVQGVRRRQP